MTAFSSLLIRYKIGLVFILATSFLFSVIFFQGSSTVKKNIEQIQSTVYPSFKMADWLEEEIKELNELYLNAITEESKDDFWITQAAKKGKLCLQVMDTIRSQDTAQILKNIQEQLIQFMVVGDSLVNNKAVKKKAVLTLIGKYELLFKSCQKYKRLKDEDFNSQLMQIHRYFSRFLYMNLLFFVFLIATFGGLFLLIKDAFKSLKQLGKDTKIIAAGNLNYQIHKTREDEIGDFQENFEFMRENIKNQLNNLDNKIKAHSVELEKKMKEHSGEQSRKIEALGRVASGAAYDFNNYLSEIERSASLISRKFSPKDAELRKTTELIFATIKRAGALTSGLLHYAQKEKPKPVKYDLHQVITKLITRFKQSIKQDVVIKTDLKSSLFDVMGSQDKIEKAFHIIIQNAQEALSSGGRISVTTELAVLNKEYQILKPYNINFGGYIVTTVNDNGMGMTPETTKRIFEPYFTTKEKSEGLGLAMAYGIIKEHNGYINVYSEPGKGSAFKIYLPLKPALSDQRNLKTFDEVMPGSGHILLIDDDEINLDTAKEMLIAMGYYVTLFSHPKNALEFYSSHTKDIDLILVDMVMPIMDGRACLKGLKKINPNVKAILCSGYNLHFEAKDIRQEGFIDILEKPYYSSKLSKAVAEAIKKTVSS